MTGTAGAGETAVDFDEQCSFRLQPNGVVILNSRMVISNAVGGRTASVRLVPGWNVGKLYPKGRTPLHVRLSAGQTVHRTATRRLTDARRLWRMLRSGADLVCASTYTVTIPAVDAP